MTRTARTTAPVLSAETGPATPLTVPRPLTPDTDQPRYVPVGDGRFVPANAAAVREVERWNHFADAMNARTAARSAAQ